MANETTVGGYRYRTSGRAKSDVQRFMPGVRGVWGGGMAGDGMAHIFP